MLDPPVEALRTGAPNAVLLLFINVLRLEVNLVYYAEELVFDVVSTATANSTTTEP
jgi:hypothetical protein